MPVFLRCFGLFIDYFGTWQQKRRAEPEWKKAHLENYFGEKFVLPKDPEKEQEIFSFVEYEKEHFADKTYPVLENRFAPVPESLYCCFCSAEFYSAARLRTHCKQNHGYSFNGRDKVKFWDVWKAVLKS